MNTVKLFTDLKHLHETSVNDLSVDPTPSFIQTLKVEPYHDSFLARYLIQRALRVSPATSFSETGHFISGCCLSLILVVQ